MPFIEKRWKFKNLLEKDVNALCEELRIHPSICGMLVNRGVTNFAAAKNFFRPNLDDLHDPWLMRDMNLAVERILNAIKKNEKILIYGDYDVDGTTSVSILYDFLGFIYPNQLIEYYIPDRYKEGYGLSINGIEYAHSNQFSVLITLDCGIKSTDLIQLAKEKNIDTIVCDHHLPGNTLPPAIAILNPKQPGCEYPYKELCGCGVGLKLIQALCKKLELQSEMYEKYLDLVATAIAADIVPITGENRILAFHGLKKANETPNIGIRALIEQSKIQNKLSITGLSFVIGPRINAAGRMGDAKRAVALFIEKDFNKAKDIASTLQVENTNRKEADASITEEALEQIENEIHFDSKKSIVVFNDHWHKGVLGIVASRLVEKFYRPTIVLTKSGDFYTGSARSIAGFNIYEGLDQCSELLHAFGGHYFAAGMTIDPKNIHPFKEKFESVASDLLEAEDMVPEIEIDSEIQLKDLNLSYYNILEQMEPFGPENPKPVFCVKKVKNLGCRIVKEHHVRFDVSQNGFRMNGIGFNLANKFEALNHPEELDIAFTLEENVFNGKITLQMKVIDFKKSEN